MEIFNNNFGPRIKALSVKSEGGLKSRDGIFYLYNHWLYKIVFTWNRIVEMDTLHRDIDPLTTMNTFAPFCSQHEKSLLRISWPFERLHFPETTVKQQSQQLETPIPYKRKTTIRSLFSWSNRQKNSSKSPPPPPRPSLNTSNSPENLQFRQKNTGRTDSSPIPTFLEPLSLSLSLSLIKS